MKEMIELLEDVKAFLLERYTFCLEEGINNKPLKQRIDMLSEAVLELQHPRWETPEQWEKRTGEKWPEGWAVYVLVRSKYTREKEYRWEAYKYYDTRPFRGHNPIVCATEAGPPPNNWRPET
jgi:hypothetical protein